MKDIKINTPYKKVQYWISWFVFIVFGGWIIALFLYNYGKSTNENTKSKKNVLNKHGRSLPLFRALFLVICSYFL